MKKLQFAAGGSLHLRENLLASLGVFVIAIPLSIGIALASGAPPSAGLIAAAVGGLVVGLFTGAPLVVSGPAAGLAALVFELVRVHGLHGLAIITALAGVIQLGFGLLRFGKVFLLVPRSVLNGMLAAIGILIAASQLHVLMGSGVPESFAAGLQALPQTLGQALSANALPITLCGLAAIAIQILWPRLKIFGLNKIPSALPAVIIITMVSMLFVMPRVEIGPIFASMLGGFHTMFDEPILSQIGMYFVPAFGLAAIASAETLLTARAIDGVVGDDKPKSNLDQELLAQGAGNTVSGVLGGIPLTGVIVRSSANVDFGATNRLSTIMHGVWVLLFVGALPFVLEAIPLTALAAILVVTGFKLLNPKQIAATYRESLREGVLWTATVAAILMTDLLLGLVIGLGMAVVLYSPAILEFAKDSLRAGELLPVSRPERKLYMAKRRRRAA